MGRKPISRDEYWTLRELSETVRLSVRTLQRHVSDPRLKGTRYELKAVLISERGNGIYGVLPADAEAWVRQYLDKPRRWRLPDEPKIRETFSFDG